MDTSIPLSNVGGLDSGPLVPFIGRYVAFVETQGYRPSSIRYQLRLIAGLNRWLDRTRRGIEEVDDLVIGRFLRQRYRKRRTHCGERSILRRLSSLLPGNGCLAKKQHTESSERNVGIVEPYRQFLLKERGLAVHTAYAYARACPKFPVFQNGRFSRLLYRPLIPHL